jgi:HK97 family phage major capsid protein
MKTSKQLIEERAALGNRITELSAKESLTDVEQTELRTALTNEDGLTAQIETALTLEKRNAEKAKEAAKIAGLPSATDNESKEMRNFSFAKFVSEGREATGFEKEMVQESQKEARELGVVQSEKGTYLSTKLMGSIVSPIMEKRTMTAASGSGGGYLIPTIKLDWFDALFALSVLDSLGVQKLTGLSANTDIPGIGTAVTSGWADGETGTQTPSDPTLVNRSLTPKLLYGATNVSKRLLIQTNQSVDQMILMDIMNSMAQALQAAVINGSGSSGVPTGILGTSGIQSVAMGTNGGAISFTKTMDLYSAVANANANLDKCKWLTNPKVTSKAMQTPIDTGSGFMILPYNSFAGGATGKIAGYDTLSTSSVPSTLTKGTSSGNCSALLFGDFSQVVVGQFGGIEIITDDLTGARSGYRAITVNQYNDLVIKQPSALGAILDITTA